MKRIYLRGVMTGLLAAALIIGSLVLPGAGVQAEAAKSAKVTAVSSGKSSGTKSSGRGKSAGKSGTRSKSSGSAGTATATAATANTTTVSLAEAAAAAAPTYPVSLAAVINGSNVIITANAGVTAPATDDGIYHLYVQNIWENGLQGTERQQQPALPVAQFTLPLAKGTNDTLLFKKFTIIGVVNGTLTQLSNTAFITNPEAIADRTRARKDTGFKGILPDAHMIVGSFDSLNQIGATEISYNMMLGQFFGKGYQYKYKGKTYNFNMSVVGGYDELLKRAEKTGKQVNMIVLCDPLLQTNGLSYVHPYSRGLQSNYYMFNTADAGAVDVEAFANFLGERYPQVDNWIIGNEVNAQDLWNAFASMDLTTFTKAYTDEFRIFYNAIKSHNANARVYVATDQEWESDNPAVHFGTKDFLTEINRQIREGGNIAWGVSNHPYNYPLYDPSVANMKNKPQVTHDMNTSKYVTMENIEVLTDFMCQPAFLAPDGTVRPVLLSEVGYTSSAAMGSNELYQAADIVYAINRAATNKYIEGIVINRQRSAAEEIAQGLDYGLLNPDQSQKVAYRWYIHAQEPEYIAAASSVLGIDILADCATYAR